MAHVVDGARAFGGLEAAIEDGKVFRLDSRRALDGPGGVDVADDRVHLGLVVAELDQRGRHRGVHDLDHAAAHQLLVLHQGEFRFNAGGVAVHHEADGPGRRQHRDLGVAESVAFAVGEGAVPGVAAGGDELLQLRNVEGARRFCEKVESCSFDIMRKSRVLLI